MTVITGLVGISQQGVTVVTVGGRKVVRWSVVSTAYGNRRAREPFKVQQANKLERGLNWEILARKNLTQPGRPWLLNAAKTTES